jgi:hypothetical protein
VVIILIQACPFVCDEDLDSSTHRDGALRMQGRIMFDRNRVTKINEVARRASPKLIVRRLKNVTHSTEISLFAPFRESTSRRCRRSGVSRIRDICAA